MAAFTNLAMFWFHCLALDLHCWDKKNWNSSLNISRERRCNITIKSIPRNFSSFRTQILVDQLFGAFFLLKCTVRVVHIYAEKKSTKVQCTFVRQNSEPPCCDNSLGVEIGQDRAGKKFICSRIFGNFSQKIMAVNFFN